MEYKPHEYADLFPLMTGAEFVELKKDIKEKGLVEPVVLYEGKILDGRNRFKACQEVGVEIRFVEYHGDDPLGFVVSINLIRRHLNESQRGMVAARIANMPRGGNGSNQFSKSANLQNSNEITQTQAAELLNVSPRTVATAKKVIDEAITELVEQVNSGEVSISAASIASSLPAQDQREIVEEIKQGGKPSEVIKSHVLATKHTGDEESYTPEKYIESARIVMGDIDLDPASNRMAQETVKAEIYYDIDNDGLAKDWKGKVWMNPPYTARVINLFIDKLVNHFNSKEVTEAIVLTNNNTDTSWFHQAAFTASAVCFTAGRINFLKRDGSKSSPTNGQAFIYFGDNVKSFRDEFSKHGLVMVKA